MREEDVLIVGAGPIGLACAISAKRHGHTPLVIDAGAIVNSIAHYPVGMGFFTTPELMEIGGHPLTCSGAKAVREEALMYYRGVARAEQLRIETYTALRELRRDNGKLVATVSGIRGNAEIRCNRIVLATGYHDNPRTLGVAGEKLPHVHHYFDEAHLSVGLDVVVVGGKNSAIEAALLLHRAGARVTLVHRGAGFPETVKYWMRPDIINRISAGEISARMSSNVTAIEERRLLVQGLSGTPETLAADRVYILIGFAPDTPLFRKLGIQIDDISGRPTFNPETLESNVKGLFLAGSICSGFKTSEIFIENGRFDGEKIFSV